jgi:hypothetical protein
MWKNDDKHVLAWIHESSAIIETKINELRASSIANQICNLGKTLPSAAIDGLIQLVSGMDEVDRQALIESFSQKLQRL